MLSKSFHQTVAVALLLIFAASELSCSTKNFPRGKRKGRRPNAEQPADPGNQQAESPAEQAGSGYGGDEPSVSDSSADSGSEPKAGNTGGNTPVTSDGGSSQTSYEPEPPMPPAKPGERVSVLGAPRPANFVFDPQRQTATGSQDRYASSLKGTQGHPRLYFNESELKDLQAKTATTHKDIAKAIFAFADAKCRQKKSLPPASMSGMGKSTGTWRKHGDRLLGVATAYVFATDPAKKKKYLDWCTESMRRMSKYSKWGPTPEFDIGLDGTHIMLGFAIAYDVCYDALSSADRKQFAERLRKQANAYYKEATARDQIFWVAAKNVNHNYTNFNAMLHAGIALENEVPEAKKWIAAAVENAAKVMELRHLVGDGSTHEGLMYSSYGSSGLFMTLDLLKRHGLADHFDNRWLKQNFLYYLHGTRPGWGRVIGSADGHGYFGHGPHHLFYFLDRMMRDGRPTWASDRIRSVTGKMLPFGKPEGCTLLFEMIWYDPSVKPREVKPNEIPTFHHFKDWGMVTYRDSWRPDSTYFTFRAGDPPGHAIWNMILKKDPRMKEAIFSHSHPDSGGFSFYPGGTDFVSGTLYQMPKRTALGNTYTFTPSGKFDPPVPKAAAKKFWDPNKLHQVGRLDELGQVGEWNRWYGPAKGIIKQRIHSEIVAANTANGAVFVSAEIGGNYPKNYKSGGKNKPFGLNRLYRNMLLLPEDVLVIVDRVETQGKMAAHCYFRSESSSKAPVLWTTDATSATLKSPKSTGSTIDLIHPKGMTMETGLEIYSWEDAKGDNHGGIKNWNEVGHSSAFVRVSNTNQSGAQTYVYLLRPDGKAARVSNLKVNDANGVSFDVEVGNRTYEAKIAMNSSASSRKAFLGFDGHCKLDFVQN